MAHTAFAFASSSTNHACNFLGALGIHKFYLGYNTSGFIMLGTSILGGILTLSVASWAIWVIAIVEGIFYLSKSQTEFEQMYVINKREWF